MIQGIQAIPARTEAEHNYTSSTLDQATLARMARTYDCVEVPVWVHDLHTRCVYRNHPAMCAPADNVRLANFDILDAEDRVVGTLTTRMD